MSETKETKKETTQEYLASLGLGGTSKRQKKREQEDKDKKKDFTTDIVIQQLNQQNIPVYGVRLEGAFPITVNAVNLDSNAENTIQKMSVTLSYENFVTEDIVDTIKSTAGVIGATLGI